MSANETQVGGTHYKAGFQHWDLVWVLGLNYFVGQATKYLSRWRLKNGLQDLKKALHFADKYLELCENWRTGGGSLPTAMKYALRSHIIARVVPPAFPVRAPYERVVLDEFLAGQTHLTPQDADLISRLVLAMNEEQFRRAVEELRVYVAEVESGPDRNYTSQS